MHRCESEDRLCLFSYDLDDEWQEVASSWHILCDTYNTFSPTTPPLSTLTTTQLDESCENCEEACKSDQASMDKCTTFLPDVTKFSSCTCEPDILSWDYTCFYLGNISCLATGGTISNLYGYTYCDNFAEVIGSGIVSSSTTSVCLVR
jgi:hypothetical protein